MYAFHRKSVELLYTGFIVRFVILIFSPTRNVFETVQMTRVISRFEIVVWCRRLGYLEMSVLYFSLSKSNKSVDFLLWSLLWYTQWFVLMLFQRESTQVISYKCPIKKLKLLFVYNLSLLFKINICSIFYLFKGISFVASLNRVV